MCGPLSPLLCPNHNDLSSPSLLSFFPLLLLPSSVQAEEARADKQLSLYTFTSVPKQQVCSAVPDPRSCPFPPPYPLSPLITRAQVAETRAWVAEVEKRLADPLRRPVRMATAPKVRALAFAVAPCPCVCGSIAVSLNRLRIPVCVCASMTAYDCVCACMLPQGLMCVCM